MNYASVVFFAFMLVSSAWYYIWGHKNYSGPPTEEDTLEGRRRSLVEQQ